MKFCENCRSMMFEKDNGLSKCFDCERLEDKEGNVIVKGFPVAWSGGECPYCQSENVEYGDSYQDDDYYIYEFECLDCAKQSREYNNIEFVNTVGMSEYQ